MVDDDSVAIPERGYCHQCGSGKVFHVVYGMIFPGSPAFDLEWIEMAGCVVDPDSRNRRCEKCGARWDEYDGEVVHANFKSLKDWWGATTDKSLVDALESRFEWRYAVTSVPLDFDPEGLLTLAYGVESMDFQFPLPDSDFHERITALNDAIVLGFATGLLNILDDAESGSDGE